MEKSKRRSERRKTMKKCCDLHLPCFCHLIIIAVVVVAIFICLAIIVAIIAKAYTHKVDKNYELDSARHNLAKEKARSYDTNTYIVTVKKQ